VLAGAPAPPAIGRLVVQPGAGRGPFDLAWWCRAGLMTQLQLLVMFPGLWRPAKTPPLAAKLLVSMVSRIHRARAGAEAWPRPGWSPRADWVNVFFFCSDRSSGHLPAGTTSRPNRGSGVRWVRLAQARRKNVIPRGAPGLLSAEIPERITGGRGARA